MAFVNESDELHGRAISLDLRGGVINQLVLAEVANVLQKRVKEKRKVVGEIKRILETIPVAELKEEDLWNALAFFANNYPKISFTDASLLAQRRRTGHEILTFDEQLASISSS